MAAMVPGFIVEISSRESGGNRAAERHHHYTVAAAQLQSAAPHCDIAAAQRTEVCSTLCRGYTAMKDVLDGASPGSHNDMRFKHGPC